MSSTRRRLGRRLLLGLASLLLGLGFAEGMARVLGLAPEVTRIEIDKPYGQFVSSDVRLLRYVPKPGSGDVNDYGIRDRDYALEKAPDTFRIVVIGDSIGYGFCTDEEALAIDDVFPNVLERRLQRRSERAVEVINLSVSGYDTAQEVEFLVQKGLALAPDLVIVAYCLNDALVASAELAAFEEDPGFRLRQQVGRELFLRSHLARLVWQASLRDASSRGRHGRAKVNRAFDRLQSLSEAHGFATLVVVFPLFVREESDWLKEQRTATGQGARARDFGLLDLSPDFGLGIAGNIDRYQGRCNREHPNEQGHALAAEAIEAYLLEKGLWPPTAPQRAGRAARPPGSSHAEPPQ